MCELLPLSQKWIDIGDSSRKAWFGAVCHRPAANLAQNVVVKGLLQNSGPATALYFFNLTLFGTKLINVIQGVLIPLLHDVIPVPLHAPSYHSLRQNLVVAKNSSIDIVLPWTVFIVASPFPMRHLEYYFRACTRCFFVL